MNFQTISKFNLSIQAALGLPQPTPEVLAECHQVCLAGQALTIEQVVGAMRVLMTGSVETGLVAEFLTAFQPETAGAQSLAAAAAVLRRYATPVPLNPQDRPLCDTCGTGGDRSGTFNISTAVALLVASAGMRVAKHGNRSITSSCGSADVLERLGVQIDGNAEHVAHSIHQAGIGFLFAPLLHGATRHVQPVRKQLAQQGIRTVFNVLGPLANPLAPEFQIVGVFSTDLVCPMAEALAYLGCHRALAVHGRDLSGQGLDEVSVCGITSCALWDGTTISTFTITPEELGLQPATLADLAGGTPQENADHLSALLAGGITGPKADAVALSTGAALWVCKKAPDLSAGLAQARELIAGGAGLRVLDRWRAV